MDRWLSSPLNVGSGTVVCQHGTLPVPAPATLALLGDAPVYAAGAADGACHTDRSSRAANVGGVLRAAAGDAHPEAGYGAGKRETPGQPNLLRLLVGEESSDNDATESIAVIETVIDDCKPQILAYVSE